VSHGFVSRAVVLGVVISAVVVLQVLAFFTGTEVYVPSVARGPGYQNSQWYTTLWIYNPSPQPADVQVYFLERGWTNPSPRVSQLQVPPGETYRISNAVETLFGLTNNFGAFRIVTSQKVLVNARNFSQPPGQGEDMSVGQSFAAIPASFGIGAGQTTEVLGVSQTTPRESSVYRYNFGFVETAGGTATVRVVAMNQDGLQIAEKAWDFGPYGAQQFNIREMLPEVNTDNIRLQVKVQESSTGRIIAFGTGLANQSNDPSTFEMAFRDDLLGGTGTGISVVNHDATLQGDGTLTSPLGIATGGVTTGKISTAGGSPGQVLTVTSAGAAWQNTSGSVGGLAGGGVLFGNASGTIGQNVTQLFWDQTGNRLGIGTNGPTDQLTLTGNLAFGPTGSGGTSGVLKLGGNRFLHNYGPTGAGNTFVGENAGNFTMYRVAGDQGTSNTGVGRLSLAANSIGYGNTASGAYSLSTNTTGWGNTASGWGSLYYNTTGSTNTASGAFTLYTNVTGSDNTAAGNSSLNANTTGSQNTAIGHQSLHTNTTGSNNIALGALAGYNLTTGSYNIDIGNPGVAFEGNTIRIGDSYQTRTFITGIRGVTTGSADAIPVLIDSAGQLGTVSSSLRFKEAVRDMGDFSNRLLELRPVTFRYIGQPERIHFGLIAEEVAEVLPELVVCDATGHVETVAYHEMPAMLLNELKKQQAEIEALKAGLAEREALAVHVGVLQMQIEQLAQKLAALEAVQAGCASEVARQTSER